MVYVKKPISDASENPKKPNSKNLSRKIAVKGKKTQPKSCETDLKLKASKPLTNNLLNALKPSNAKRKNEKQELKHQTKITSFLSATEKENAGVKRALRSKGLGSSPENDIEVVKKICIPIWKKHQENEEFKVTPNIDVYDISEDEQMQNEDKFQKKKTKRPKANARKNIGSKKPKKALLPKSDTGISKVMKRDTHVVPLYETAEIVSLPLTLQDGNTTLSSPEMDTIPIDCSSLVPAAQILPSEMETNEPQPPVQETAMNDASFELDKTTFLSQLADEIERSFLIPLMTSTPSERCQKEKGNQPETLNTSLLQSNFVEQRAPALPKTKASSDKDIKLFESPEKKKKHKTVPSKTIPTMLSEMSFEKEPPSPMKNADLETSVLQPSRSYQSQDNFKTHLVRTKRSAAANPKCSQKKTKDQLMIEKMAKHFEEIGETELCIE